MNLKYIFKKITKKKDLEVCDIEEKTTFSQTFLDGMIKLKNYNVTVRRAENWSNYSISQL